MAGLTAAAAGPFLARLIRLDPAAVVRLRPAGPGTVALWGRVPWGVLVTCQAPASSIVDITVAAEALLRGLTHGDHTLPPARDQDWRWALPPGPGEAVEVLPAPSVRRLGAAAAETVRTTRGRVGDRVLRDALLAHVSITVAAADREIPVRQALVQALLRMGFMGTGDLRDVTVRTVGSWVGLAADSGSVWLHNAPNLKIRMVK
jgi:hypothetical protein